MSSKSASLTSGLVAKKGQAAPAVVAPIQHEEKPQSSTYYKALTVKLDRDRYEELKRAGVKFDRKSQDIFVEALDLWFKKNVEIYK